MKLILRGEIRAICEVIDRLRSEATNFIPLVRVFEIGALRQGYDAHSEWVVIFREEAFKEEVMAWYRELGILAMQTQATEGAGPGDAAAEQFRSNERTRIINRYGDLAAQGRNLLERVGRQ